MGGDHTITYPILQAVKVSQLAAGRGGAGHQLGWRLKNFTNGWINFQERYNLQLTAIVYRVFILETKESLKSRPA